MTHQEQSIGERIRESRKKLGLNQSELAARIGVTQPAIANWESGVHDPRRLMLAKLADTLAVAPEWLGSGARSETEIDKTAAAAYLRRPIRHTPVISFEAAARVLIEPDFDPHTVAQDYIPVTYGTDRIFGLFVTDEAVNLEFPRDTLVVIDYADRKPQDGMFCLASRDGFPILRQWRKDPDRLIPCSNNSSFSEVLFSPGTEVIGCARYSIRVH